MQVSVSWKGQQSGEVEGKKGQRGDDDDDDDDDGCDGGDGNDDGNKLSTTTFAGTALSPSS